MELEKIRMWGISIANYAFLVFLNLAIISIIGYLTLDSEANLNSRLAAILVSFFIPYFIVTKSEQMHGLERMLKFGAGFIFYAILSGIMVGLPMAIQFCLLPCLIIGLATLYYGDRLT